LDFQKESSIHITCALGISDYLAAELEENNFTIINQAKNHVITSGSLTDCIRLNLILRTAYRVYYELKVINCPDQQSLKHSLSKIKWEKIVSTKGCITIQSFANHPSVNNSMYLNQLVKDGIADYFRTQFNERPDSGKWNEDAVSLFVHWADRKARIYLDTTGQPLGKRGYRQQGLYAPMQETLAAAIVMASGWNRYSDLYNPMCGSGTIAIEAALMAANIVPGLLREHFSVQNISGFDKQVLLNMKKSLYKQVNSEPNRVIYASDHSAGAIKAAFENACRAGVERWIDFSNSELESVKIAESEGVVIINPPYGKRLGEEESLIPLYKQIGEFFKKKCIGKTCFVFTGSRLLSHQIGLKTSKRLIFFNGDIECRLLGYEMYAGSKKRN